MSRVSQQVKERLRLTRRTNRRIAAFLAVLAVLGVWGGNKRIQDRIDARKRSAFVMPPKVITPAREVEVLIPGGAKPETADLVMGAVHQ